MEAILRLRRSTSTNKGAKQQTHQIRKGLYHHRYFDTHPQPRDLHHIKCVFLGFIYLFYIDLFLLFSAVFAGFGQKEGFWWFLICLTNQIKQCIGKDF